MEERLTLQGFHDSKISSDYQLFIHRALLAAQNDDSVTAGTIQEGGRSIYFCQA